MAVTITDHRTVWNGSEGQADAATNWTGATTVFTTDPNPVESTGSLGIVVAIATSDAYNTAGAGVNLSNKLIWVWVYPRGANDTTANGGLQVHLGDGTNRIGFHVAGTDLASFRHDTGPVGWQSMLIDTSNLPATTTTRAGSLGSLNLSSITQLGAIFKNLAMAPGGIANYFIDIMRYMDPTANDGCALSIIGGSSGDPGTFSQIAAVDRSTGDLQGYGVIRELGAGAYGLQAPIRFGNATGSSSSWFEDINATVVFENRGLLTTRYKIVITDNGTGTTTFILGEKVGTGSSATGANGCSLVVPSGVGASFDSGTDTDVTDVFIYGSTFSGFTNGIILGSGQEFIGCTVAGSGAITFTGSTGPTLVNTNINTSTVAADASAVVWNVNADTSGKLDGMNFSKGTNAHHAIQLGTSSPTEVTFSGITFSGFNASNGQNDSTILVSRSSGTVTINITNNGDTPSYKTAGATVVINNPKTLDIHVQDTATNPIQNAQVAVYDSSDNSELVNELTDASGDIVQASIAGGTNIYVRVRKSTSGTRYFPAETVATVNDNLALTITLREDTIVT